MLLGPLAPLACSFHRNRQRCGGGQLLRFFKKKIKGCDDPAPRVQLGGNLNNGSNDGPFYANVNNGLSNANWTYGAFGMLCGENESVFYTLGRRNPRP